MYSKCTTVITVFLQNLNVLEFEKKINGLKALEFIKKRSKVLENILLALVSGHFFTLKNKLRWFMVIASP